MSRKISQDEMAKTLGINRSSYHKKENGLIKISVEEFGAILDKLEIPRESAGNFFA
jgi:DNA-binding XRE family transcriptional regulator